MKNLTIFLLVLFFYSPFALAQDDSVYIKPDPIEVPANPDSLAKEIGVVKSVTINDDGQHVVVNDKKEEFVLTGQNVGELLSLIMTGASEIKQNVSQTEGRPIDWILEIVKWLLGGGSLASIIAVATRSINGVKDLFAGIVANQKIVFGIAGVLAFVWLYFFQGGDLSDAMFWATWGATWFSFGMFAIGIYETIIRTFKKTPKTPKQITVAIDNAKKLLEDNGAKVQLAGV